MLIVARERSTTTGDASARSESSRGPNEGFLLHQAGVSIRLRLNSASNSVVVSSQVPEGFTAPLPDDKGNENKTAVALIGVAKGEKAVWLVTVSQATQVGMGISRIRAISLDVFPQNGSPSISGQSPTNEVDSEFANSMQALFATGLFYFSSHQSGIEITRSLQNASHTAAAAAAATDDLFVFNRAFMHGLENVPKSILRPVIQGCVASFSFRKHISCAIITRRCAEHSGARFWARGLDANGYGLFCFCLSSPIGLRLKITRLWEHASHKKIIAANFCETEIVMLHQEQKQVWSMVIVRGSIPVQWLV